MINLRCWLVGHRVMGRAHGGMVDRRTMRQGYQVFCGRCLQWIKVK